MIRRFASLLTLLPLLLSLTGCAPKGGCPRNGAWQRSKTDAPAPLRFATDRPLHGSSAFTTLSEAADAYAARLWLVDHARHTLDVQYYIFKDDAIGNDFLYHLFQAAERGVNVRILLDDLTTTGEDSDWAMAACHPNISLKLFNPNPWRRFLRNIALVLDLETLGKRMHNKALVADGKAAIVGGRNIGDEYFLARSPVLFIDLDVLAAGDVVAQISKAFDLYWHSDEAVEASKILEGGFDERSLRKAREAFVARNRRFEASDAFTPFRRAPFIRKVREGTLRLTVADNAWFYYDLPQKVSTPTDEDATHLSRRIREDIEGARHDLLLVSPYFIPTPSLMKKLEEARKRGVEVTVVTNSLASTDVAVVYSGYRKYIAPLLKMGVRLYEVKPRPLQEARGLEREEARHLRMSLHTKMVVADDDRFAVGSANIDPRSEKLNTEYLLEIASVPLTKRVRGKVAKVLNETHLYRVVWEKYPAWAANGDESYYGPVWVTTERGKRVRYYRPPGVGFFKRLGIGLFGLLPVEGQL